MKHILQKALHAIVYLSGAIAAGKSFGGLTGTEAIGGAVTGPVISFAALGCILLLSMAIVAFLSPRIAAIGGPLACGLCLPLYTYRTLPRLFRLVFPGEYKGALEGTLIWDRWTIAGAITTAVSAYLFYRSVLSLPRKK